MFAPLTLVSKPELEVIDGGDVGSSDTGGGSLREAEDDCLVWLVDTVFGRDSRGDKELTKRIFFVSSNPSDIIRAMARMDT